MPIVSNVLYLLHIIIFIHKRHLNSGRLWWLLLNKEILLWLKKATVTSMQLHMNCQASNTAVPLQALMLCMCFSSKVFLNYNKVVRWCSIYFNFSHSIIILPGAGLAQCQSARLPPMWPGFDSLTRRHMWAEFVGSLRVLRFSPLLKNQNLIWFDLICVELSWFDFICFDLQRGYPR